MGIDPHISLLVAALDLKEVQLIRAAIRVADLSSGRGEPASGLGPAPNPDEVFEPRRHIHPEPVYEPRPHIHPEPRYEPRPIIHPTPRIEQQLNDRWECCPPPVVEVKPAESPCPSPIQPPWKVLPWQNPTPPTPVVRPLKVIIRRPDIVSKGGLLDVFI